MGYEATEHTRALARARYARTREKHAAYSKKWRETHPEKVKAWAEKYRAVSKATRRGRHLRWYYGITEEAYAAMVLAQGGLCEICKKSEPRGLRVDHNHATNKVRALLCDACNKGLGHFSENPTAIRAAAEYLERYGSKV